MIYTLSCFKTDIHTFFIIVYKSTEDIALRTEEIILHTKKLDSDTIILENLLYENVFCYCMEKNMKLNVKLVNCVRI